ncbi:MAG: hypothetical protein VYA34_01000 [Myxococcota bacterium]|nr:hypothetical protein [Myxococcota bacterium]
MSLRNVVLRPGHGLFCFSVSAEIYLEAIEIVVRKIVWHLIWPVVQACDSGL